MKKKDELLMFDNVSDQSQYDDDFSDAGTHAQSVNFGS